MLRIRRAALLSVLNPVQIYFIRTWIPRKQPGLISGWQNTDSSNPVIYSFLDILSWWVIISVVKLSKTNLHLVFCLNSTSSHLFLLFLARQNLFCHKSFKGICLWFNYIHYKLCLDKLNGMIKVLLQETYSHHSYHLCSCAQPLVCILRSFWVCL